MGTVVEQGPILQPLQLLVGDGKNAKYVKACTEIFLGNKGLHHLQGFERLVNLEVLWVNNNQLTSITGLNKNVRLKGIHAENNSICSLKGSLQRFHFLETLDLSSNQLRDLAKLASALAKFRFLSFLNLKGNPCCEEADYRLTLIHAIPSLQVLDLHQVTREERKSAASNIGGQAGQLGIAFGKKARQYDPGWDDKVSERSGLEQDLGHTVQLVKAKRIAQEGQAEAQMYARDPYSMKPTLLGQPLPAPPGFSTVQHVTRKDEPAPAIMAAQQRYQPLDVFSFVAYQTANAADNSISNRFTGKLGNDFFSNSVLQTGSTRNSAPVQLVQRRFNI